MSSLKKNFAYNIIYQFLTILLPLITAPYISRTLGAEGVGIYSYTYSVAQYFLLFAMLGISNHGNRSIAASRDNHKKLEKTFWSIYSIQATMYIIAIIAYMGYVFLLNIENRKIALIQFILVLSGLFDVSWYFFGTEQFKITVTRNIVIKVATVILMFVFVHNPNDLWKYTLLMTLGTLFSQTYLWVYIRKQISFSKVSFVEIKKHFKQILILFVPVISYSIYKLMDKIMLGNMTEYFQVGYYENATKIINIPMGVITALGTVMLPRMSNIAAQGDNKKSEEYIRLSIRFVSLAGSAIAFGLIGISEVFVPIYFGDEFKACSPLIRMLAITVFFISWANVIRTQYLIPYHKDNVYLLSTIIGAVVNLIVNFLFIPKLQGVGAAIGTIIAEFTVMISQIIGVRKELNVVKHIISSIPFIAFGAVMAIIVFEIGKIMDNGILPLIIQILIGGISYMLLCVSWIIVTKDEFRKYLSFIKK